MKRILVLAISLFAPAAFAVCDQSFTMTVTYKGQPVAESTTTYRGLEAADVADLNKRGKSILDVASKQQDKGGGYAADFSESRACDGAASKIADGARVEGVTLQGLGHILKQGAKVSNDLIKLGDDHAAKGKKRAWGKE